MFHLGDAVREIAILGGYVRNFVRSGGCAKPPRNVKSPRQFRIGLRGTWVPLFELSSGWQPGRNRFALWLALAPEFSRRNSCSPWPSRPTPMHSAGSNRGCPSLPTKSAAEESSRSENRGAQRGLDRAGPRLALRCSEKKQAGWLLARMIAARNFFGGVKIVSDPHTRRAVPS